jgi:hypothetical protein
MHVQILGDSIYGHHLELGVRVAVEVWYGDIMF